MVILGFGTALFGIIMSGLVGLLSIIVMFIILFVALGYVNSWIEKVIWHMRTESSTWAFFFHGVLLFVVLLIVGIPRIVLAMVFPGDAIALFLLIAYIPIYGVLAKKVAENFESGAVKPVKKEFLDEGTAWRRD